MSEQDAAAPQGLISSHSVAHEMAIVCTDRGQHARVRLTTVRWWQADEGDEPDQVTIANAGRKFDQDGREPYTFWCGKCTRRPQVSVARWSVLHAAAFRDRIRELDMSYLD